MSITSIGVKPYTSEFLPSSAIKSQDLPLSSGATVSDSPASDSVKFTSGAKASETPAKTAGSAEAAPANETGRKPVLSQAQVESALKDIFAGAPPENGSPATLGAGDFYMAGCSLEATGGVPTRSDVSGYTYIEPQEAAKTYESDVKPNIGFLERKCIKAYCTFSYKAMNSYLTGAKGSPTGTLRRAVNCMAGALNRFDVPQGSVLYRTSNINELHNYVDNDDFAKYKSYSEMCKTKELAEILDARLQGTETKRKTFLSTTVDHNFDFEDKPKVATKLYVGDNVHGIYVAADSKLTRFPDEKEYLLAPDTKVTVLGCDYNERNNGLVLHVFLGDLPQNSEASNG